jgi:hypothetical protein
MDVKQQVNRRVDHQVHLLTEKDGEDILIAIDSLYWSVMRLLTKRSLDVAHDPYELARNVQGERKGD